MARHYGIPYMGSKQKLVKAVNTRSLLNSSKSEKSSYNYENVYWNGVQ